MKQKTILASVFLMVIFFSFGQTKYKQNLANVATIDFPSQPKQLDTLGQKIFSYSDEKANYVIVVTELNKEKGLQLKEGELYKFYDGAINGVIKTSAGKLINKRKIDIDGLKGIEIEFISNSTSNELKFERMLFFNTTIFAINFWTTSDNKTLTEDKRNSYFSSFSVTVDKKNIKQFTIPADK